MLPSDSSTLLFPEDHAVEIHASRCGDGVLQVLDDGQRRWLRYRNGALQSGMHKRRPESLVLPYTRAMASVLLFVTDPRNVLILGLGGGSLVRFFLHHYPDTRLSVVEREPGCVTIAQELFSVPRDGPRVEITIGDARDVLPELQDQFDLVMLDLFLAHGPPSWLRLPRLFDACRARLADGGALSANLWIEPEDEALMTLRGVSGAFKNKLLLIPVAGYRNTIALAFPDCAELPDLATLRARARSASGRLGFDVQSWLRVLEATNPAELARRTV